MQPRVEVSGHDHGRRSTIDSDHQPGRALMPVHREHDFNIARAAFTGGEPNDLELLIEPFNGFVRQPQHICKFKHASSLYSAARTE